MKIETMGELSGNDFHATYICEHCQHTERKPGYNDGHFHNNVIPKMVCGKCNKNRAGYIEQPLYFGCWAKDKIGHYLMDIKGIHFLDDELTPSLLDGKFAPDDNHQKEGVAKCFYILGRTAFAFWDRSADSRPGSNCVFLIPGTMTFELALEEARKNFPTIFARFNFPITEYRP